MVPHNKARQRYVTSLKEIMHLLTTRQSNTFCKLASSCVPLEGAKELINETKRASLYDPLDAIHDLMHLWHAPFRRDPPSLADVDAGFPAWIDHGGHLEVEAERVKERLF